MSNEITNSEKNIYNTFLITSRKVRNKPFKVRQDFRTLEVKDIICLKKLKIFFDKFDWVIPQQYFEAPYKLYSDQDWFGLDFFVSQKGIKTFTIYLKKLKMSAPDEQIDFIKESLKFISKYCITENISLSNYITKKRGISYDWMKHVAKNKISIYILLEFPNIYDMITSIPTDELELLLGDFLKEYGNIKQRYENSIKAKNIIKNGLSIISTFIDKNLKNKVENQ